MRKSFLLVSLLAFARYCPAQATIYLDGNGKGKIFEGICGVNAGGGVGRLLINYPEPQRKMILDYLFKPNYGASFQSYKAEIGGDGNSTEGSEPSHMHTPSDQNYNRGYQWWMMEEAKKRNSNIVLMALAWDFPAWIKEVNSQATADYLVNYVKGAKRVHNLDIAYLGIWNETKTNNAFIPLLRETLDRSGLRKVKIIADDLVRTWAIADSMRKDRKLFNSVDVISTHYPKYESGKAGELNKPMWSTEDGPWGDQWGETGQQSGSLASLLNLNYIRGKMTSTHIWNIITAYYDILDIPYAGEVRAMTPWSGSFKVMSPTWVTAHTTQFAYPGWRYIDTACTELKGGGSLVALKSGSKYSVVIETLNALEDQQLIFKISNNLSTGTVFVWHTDSLHSFEKLGALTPINGSYRFTAKKNSVYSLTTTTGQGKGNAVADLDSPFKLPYRENFEKYSLGYSTPAYFIEQNGAYEVVETLHRGKTKALKQMVSRSPLVWTYGHTAYLLGTASIIGDKNWSDYSVRADILLEEPGYARVMGRVSRVTLDGQINGYQLYLTDKGAWKLVYSTTGTAMDSGIVHCRLNEWHNLRLAFRGDTISAYIDCKLLSRQFNTKFSAGMAGIGNGYNKGLYDNIVIAPLDSLTPVIPVVMVKNRFFLERIPETPLMHLCVPLPNAVKVSWDGVPGAKGYKIRFGTVDGDYTSMADVGNLTSYTIWTLKSNQRYYFVVSAYNDKGESKRSGMEPATTR